MINNNINNENIDNKLNNNNLIHLNTPNISTNLINIDYTEDNINDHINSAH